MANINTPHWHVWSVEPLNILESEVASESKIEDHLNGQQPEPEEEGDTIVRMAFQQQDVVRSRILIKWSTPLTLMATVQTQQIREERW